MTRTDHNWPVLIVAYFIIQTLFRTFIGSGLGLDEAEMMLTAQSLEWGYGPQPPLYSWIQYGVFSILGDTVFALALVKNSLLCISYLVLYRLLRSEYDKESSGLATLSLLLLPQIAWESQRALSHSVLATAMVIVTFAAFSRLSKQQDTRSYLLFGVAIAFGVLSKFNYLLLAIAILLAAMTLPATRKSVINPRLLLTFGVIAAILAKPVYWIINHQTKTLASVHKFKIAHDTSLFQDAFDGFLDLSLASFSFLALLIAVLFILFLCYRNQVACPPGSPILFQIMSRTVVTALLLTVIVVLASGTTNVKDRWLQPVLIFTAPTMVLWLLPRVSKLARQRLSQIFFAAALLIIVALPLYNLYGGLKKPSRRNAPFLAVTKVINEKYPDVKTVFAQDKWVGGNLLNCNKSWQVEVPGHSPESLKGNVILVWQSDNPVAPSSMLEELKTQGRTIVAIDPTTSLHLPYPAKPKSIFSVSFASVLIK